jgi:hypothetical protein
MPPSRPPEFDEGTLEVLPYHITRRKHSPWGRPSFFVVCHLFVVCRAAYSTTDG